MSVPACPHDGQPCTAPCAGEPPCKRAWDAFGRRVARGLAIARAKDAVIDGARHYTEHVWAIGLRGSGAVRQALMRAVEALDALEGGE